MNTEVKNSTVISEEKLALAEELGLHSYVRMKQREIKMVEEALNLKFKKTNTEDVTKEIRWMVCKARLLKGISILSAIFSVSICGAIYARGPIYGPLALLFILSSSFFGIVPLIRWTLGRDVRIGSMPLSQWEQEIPYGALLAVKEAQDKGIDDFEIFYPTVKADPIILGKKYYDSEHRRGGWFNFYKVYQWDDRKIYE